MSNANVEKYDDHSDRTTVVVEKAGRRKVRRTELPAYKLEAMKRVRVDDVYGD